VKLPPAPIRFLLLIVGGWISLRVVTLAPGWLADPAPAAPAAAPAQAPFADAALPAPGPAGMMEAAAAHPSHRTWTLRPEPFPLRLAAAMASIRPRLFASFPARLRFPIAPPRAVGAFADPAAPRPPLQLAPAPPFALSPSPPAPVRASASRWSGSAWLFLREGRSSGLAPAGTLGGSQAGGRINYRINADRERALALSARLYLPIERLQGFEAALGLDWRPLRDLPLHVLAERRQRLGRDGRSDFSLTLYGGGEQRLLRGKLRIEAYGQAGIVGIEERDLFADGAVRASVRLGPAELGAGAWGGAQPGASRLDIGPQATIRLPLGPTNLRASAEWRFRVGGDAAPGSGPALTLSTDF